MKKSMIVKTLAVVSVSLTGLLSSAPVLAQENKTEQFSILSVRGIQKQLDLLKEKVEKEKNTLACLHAKLEKLENNINSDLKKAHESIKDKKALMEELTKEESELSSRIAQYESEIETLNNQKTKDEQILKDTRDKANTLEKNKKDLNVAEGVLSDADKALESAKSDYDSVKNMIQMKNIDYEVHIKTKSAHANNIQKQKNFIKDLEDLYNKYPTKETKEEINQYKQKLEYETAQYLKAEADCKAVEEELKKLNKQLAAKKIIYDNAVSVKTNAENQYNVMKNVVAESEEAKSKISGLETALKELSETIEQKKTDLSNLKVQREAILEQLKSLSNLPAYNEDVNRLETTWNEILNGSSAVPESEYEDLQPIVVNMNEYVNVRNEVDKVKANIEKLEQEIQEKESLLAKAKEAEKNANKTDKIIKKDVSTALGLDAGLYASLAAISTAGFTVSMVKSKRKK